MDILAKNLAGLDDAVDRCLDARLILPGLALLYAGIDIMASLERQPSEGTKASFTRWVDMYLLPAKPLGCSALELYAARCGILYTFTADSELSQAAIVRKIFYAWGNAASHDLQETARLLGRTNIVALHVDDLCDAYRLGIAAWTMEVTADQTRREIVQSRESAWFDGLSIAVVKDFLGNT